MSIDLVMGVMQASNKAKTQRAESRLAAMDGAGPGLFRKIVMALEKLPLGSRISTEKASLSNGSISTANSGGDILAGVMAAADPKNKLVALAKLQGLSGGETVDVGVSDLDRNTVAALDELPLGSFAADEKAGISNGVVSIGSSGGDLLADVMAAANPKGKLLAQAKLQGLYTSKPVVAGLDDDDSAQMQAMQKLEGALLSAVTDQILPKSSSSQYGSGTAGELARHFQVEQLAEASAEAEPLGLAKRFYGQTEDGAAEGLLQISDQWPYFGRRTITPYSA